MTKKIILLSIFVLMLNQAKSQRNVVLILADDLGTDYCGFYEDRQDTANLPNIRRLLGKGVRFTNAISNPVCSPTRAGIFTGRFSFRTGVTTAVAANRSNGIDTSEMSLPRVMNKVVPNGIAKALFGKWHLNLDTPVTNFQIPNLMGFDHYQGGFLAQVWNYYDWPKITNGVKGNTKNYATTENVNDGLKWLKTLPNGKPFFLYLSFNAPHVPYHLPPAGMYSDTTLSGTSADIAAFPKKYFKADLEALDHEFGRMMDSLKSLNLYDSTDFIFLGDNGNEAQVAQNAIDTTRSKGTLYQGGVHVPLIISGPSVINGGRTSHALANCQDLFATILELMRCTAWQTYIPQNRPIDSKSLLPILRNTATEVRSFGYSEHKNAKNPKFDGQTMRNKTYKLLKFNWDQHQEFYNLINDSNEYINLNDGNLTNEELFNYNTLCAGMSNLNGMGSYCNVAYNKPAIIISTANTNVCSGSSVTFTADIVNGGATPVYQWKKNGINVGTNSNTYSTTSLVNGDKINCILKASLTDSAVSNQITMTVSNNVTPTISISTTTPGICIGANVTFTSIVTNGGSSPSYQWKKNGVNIGSNNAVFSSNSIVKGDKISCTLTSNATCKTTAIANSNQITMTVNSAVPSLPSTVTGEKYNLCNTSANFTYSILPLSSAVSYIWTVPNYASIASGQGTNAIVVNYSSQFRAGVMTVKASNYCGTGPTRSNQVYAKPYIQPTIVGLNSVCANQLNVPYSISPAIGATSYNWYAPAGASIASGQGSTVVTVNYGLSGGELYVTGKNACGTSAKSKLQITINCRMGNDGEYEKLNPELYFAINPSSLNITTDTNIENATVTIYDVTGRIVYSINNVSILSNEPNQLVLNKTLSKGIYVLKVENGRINVNSKLNYQ